MKTSFKIKFKFLAACFLSALILILINGCKSDNVVQQNADNVDFSSASSSEMIDAGILEIDEVKILIKDIKLNVASTNENTANFKTGPFVLYLDFTSNVNLISTGYITAGTYDKVLFEIHKLADNETPPDPEFADANGRYSIIVKGRYNSISFTFKSSVSCHQKLSFPKSLTVTSEGKSNITLMAKPYIWFIINGGFVDPMNQINRNNIELNIINNINENFKVFVDNDHNGQPD
jgi:hypothetical protein